MPLRTESVVINAVCLYLETREFEIRERHYPRQRGDDIVASKNRVNLHVEAKGEGAEREGNEDAFKRGQVHDHVAKAFFRAAQMRRAAATGERRKVAMAFPDNQHHREMVRKISNAIQALKITVFWVNRDHVGLDPSYL
jgi:hypothetical protein